MYRWSKTKRSGSWEMLLKRRYRWTPQPVLMDSLSLCRACKSSRQSPTPTLEYFCMGIVHSVSRTRSFLLTMVVWCKCSNALKSDNNQIISTIVLLLGKVLSKCKIKFCNQTWILISKCLLLCMASLRTMAEIWHILSSPKFNLFIWVSMGIKTFNSRTNFIIRTLFRDKSLEGRRTTQK